MSGSEDDAEDVAREFGLGLLAGLAAWLLGYLLQYGWRRLGLARGRPANVGIGAAEFELTTGTVAGWLFYNAHFVSTHVPVEGQRAPDRINLLVEFGGAALVWLLLPIVLLLAAGYLAASTADAVGSAADGARLGAMTVAGYLPLSAIGITLFIVADGNALYRPAPTTALLLAGLAYPLVFGTVGGVLAWVVDR